MPRYDNGHDWIEVSPEAARHTIRELMVLDGDSLTRAHETAVRLTTDAHFIDPAGNVVDWRADVTGMTVPQWNWWKRQIWAAARDETISPEA